MVFVGTGNCVTSPTGWGPLSEAIVALDLDSGEVQWTYQPHPPNNDDFDFAGAPNLFEIDGRPVVGLGNKDAAFYVVDRATGALVWSTQATTPGIDERGSNYSYGGFIGPATYSDGRIVGGTAVGGTPALHAFDAATGAIVWQQPSAGPTYAAAAAANGVVFLGGTDFTLRALDLADGAVLWKHTMSGAVAGGAAIVGDNVFAVAGLREPGNGKRSRTSGVYRFSLTGTPVGSTTTTRCIRDRNDGCPAAEPESVRRRTVCGPVPAEDPTRGHPTRPRALGALSNPGVCRSTARASVIPLGGFDPGATPPRSAPPGTGCSCRSATTTPLVDSCACSTTTVAAPRPRS